MAGSRKEFELLFKLKASLGSNFNSTFKSAIETQKTLQDSLKNVNFLQEKINGYNKASNAINQQNEKLARLQTEHQKTVQKIQTHQQNVERLRAKIEEIGDATGELIAQLMREENEVQKNTEKLKSNESQIQRTRASIEQQKQQLESMSEELQEAGVNTDALEEANGRLQRSYERLQNSEQTLQRLNQVQQNIGQSINDTKLKLGATVGVISGVAAAVYAGPVKSAQEYETAMAKVSTIADNTKVPIDTISKEIMALSNITGIAATSLADDVYNAISAGQDTADAVNFVSYSSKLAKAGFAESAQTLDVLTTILNAYGLEADKVGMVSDMLIQTQNKGKVTVAELSSVMGKIIPTAKSNGVALEQITAGYAIMTSKGIAAAETTTYMNSMLNELGKSGTTADKALRAVVGTGFKDLMAEGKSISEVLDILKESAEKGGKSLADVFGSAEAGKAAVTLLSDGVEGFNDQVKNMLAASDSIGATQAAFELMEDTTQAKLEKAKNSIHNLSTVIGQTFLPMIGTIAENITPIVAKISEFAQVNPKLVQTIAKAAAGFAVFRVSMLSLKLAGLTGASGIVSLLQKLMGLRISFLESAATGTSFATKLKAAGSGVLKYFKGIGGALGGMGSAIGNIFSSSTIFQKVGGLFSGIAGKMSAGFAGKLGGVLTGTGSKLLSLLLKPFGNIGGALGGILSKVGGVILNSPLGSIGKVIASSFGKLGTLIAPIGNVLKTALGPLGGIAGKFLPIIGIITTIIAVVQILRKNFDKVREAVGNIFGEKGLEIFDKIVAVITNVGETIKGVFSDGNIGAARDKINELFGEKGVAVFDTFAGVFQKIVTAAGQFVDFVTTHIVPVLERVFNVLITSVIPGIISGIQAAAPVVMQIFQAIANFIAGIIPVIGSFIAGIMPIIREVITFIQTYVFPIISEVFNFIVSTVLPLIVQGIQQLGSIITMVFSAVLPVVQHVFSTIWSMIQPVLAQILSTVQAVLPVVLSVFQSVFNAIGGVIRVAQQIFNGLIQFITGVFTGNWSAAWEGVKSIFSGIWNGIKLICTGVINGIVGAVNVVIRGLNSLKIPDWVPGIGGKGINIPEIPQLAKGSKNTPQTFIAGERGPELITNAPGRTVFTAQQTKDIFNAQNAAANTAAAVQAAGVTNITNNNAPENVPGVSAPELRSTTRQSSITVTINNNPVIHVDGDKSGDLEEKLEENNRRLLQQVKDLLDKRDDDERRSVYA